MQYFKAGIPRVHTSLCLLLAAAVLNPTLILADPASKTVTAASAFSDLGESIKAMRQKYVPTDVADKTPSRIADAAADLSAKFKNSGQCPVDYAQTIEEDAGEIEAAVSLSDKTISAKMLSDVSADLSAKEMHANAFSNLMESLGDDVTVQFTTSHDGQSVKNYLIRCNRPRYADDTNPAVVFSDPTSPKTQTLAPPGRYICWALLPPETKRINSELYDFGQSGKSFEAFVMLIP